MNRLHYRLSLAMLGIVVVLGGAFYWIDRYSARMYYEELTQRLNASLAKEIVNAEPLIVDGRVDSERLRALASRAMVINPNAEIYLLGPDGTILGHALPPEDIGLDRVDLGPVMDVLDESRPLPVKGSNPREPDSPKVFSAFPIPAGEESEAPAGYLYVVLGGRQYEAVASAVAAGYNRRVLAAGLVLVLAAAFVAGFLLFAFLTRRLRRLTDDVAAVADKDFRNDVTVDAVPEPHDEIDQLRNACHHMTQTIRQQISTLQENDRLRRELFTNISHDLRTPLASMQGYIETLIIKDETLDRATRREYLEIARKHATRLGRLVQDLLELSMLETSRFMPAFEEFPLVELIYDVVQEFELQAREARVLLVVEPPDEPVLVHADIRLIERVLENLLANALRHTPEGGKVTVTVSPASDAVGITVADTGCGISKDDLPYIFDRFYRTAPGSASNGSVGLGLAIAKRILELHGSEIRVVSEERRGTRFDFDLSLERRAA